MELFLQHKSARVGILIWDEGGKLDGACSKKLLAPLGAVEADNAMSALSPYYYA